jgi:hypothetical protein
LFPQVSLKPKHLARFWPYDKGLLYLASYACHKHISDHASFRVMCLFIAGFNQDWNVMQNFSETCMKESVKNSHSGILLEVYEKTKLKMDNGQLLLLLIIIIIE